MCLGERLVVLSSCCQQEKLSDPAYERRAHLDGILIKCNPVPLIVALMRTKQFIKDRVIQSKALGLLLILVKDAGCRQRFLDVNGLDAVAETIRNCTHYVCV